MCFSASANFTVAAIAGAAGLFTMTHADARDQWLVASVPWFFALQQTVEGFLWLALVDGEGSALASALTGIYLVFAEAWWPVFVPVAILVAEPDRQRHGPLRVLAGIGILVATYLLWSLTSGPHRAVINVNHLVYATGQSHPVLIGLVYLIPTVLPLLVSSQRALNSLGVVIFIGALTAYLISPEAFLSVWCFFAAATSAILVFHFERRHRSLRTGAVL